MPLLQATDRRRQTVDFSDVDLDDPASIVQFIEGRWADRERSRQSIERDWFIAVAYFLGFQYHQWANYGDRLYIPPAPPWRVRLVVNRLMVIVRQVVARFIKQKPRWEVIPATTDDDDVMASKIAQRLLEYLWRENNLDQTLVELFTWMAVTGNSFLRVSWDPTAKSEMSFRPDELGPGEEAGGEGGGGSLLGRLKGILGLGAEDEVPEEIRLNEGDFAFDVANCFEIDPDPSCTDLDHARFLIDSKARPVSYFEDRYGIKIPKPERDDENLTRYYLDRIADFPEATISDSSSDYSDDRRTETALEHTLWVNPSSQNEGGFFVVAGGKLIHQGPLDTPKIPYAHFQEIRVPGRFWGTSSMQQCIDLQLEYNRARSQLIENRNLMSRPKWLLPKGSGVQETALTSEPGEVVEYNFPMKPEMVTPPQVPEYVHQTLDSALRDMEDVSSIHEVSQARVPTGARSGVALAQLQEQDQTALAPSILMAEDGLSKIGSWALRIAARRIKVPRLIKVVGENQRIEVMQFIGAHLIGANDGQPGVNYYDVEVQMGSALPISKAARTEWVTQLAQYGIIDVSNPQERLKLLKMLELGTEETLYEEAQLDEKAAHRENLQMAQGQDLVINPWDEDEVHIHEHRQFQKRAEFERIFRRNPLVLEIFEAHIAQHVERARATLEASQPAGPPDENAPEEVPQEEGADMTGEEMLAMRIAEGV